MQTGNNTGGSVLDVLSGKTAAKIDVSINTTSMVIIGITILIAVAIGVIIGKKTG